MDEDVKTMLGDISKWNAGALDVCIQLMARYPGVVVFDFVRLRDSNIVGSELWYLYNDCCERDIEKLHSTIMRGQGIEMLKKVFGSSFYVKPAQ